MPLLIPLFVGGAGFVSGFFVGDKFGWVKWLVIAVLVFIGLKKMGVV